MCQKMRYSNKLNKFKNDNWGVTQCSSSASTASGTPLNLLLHSIAQKDTAAILNANAQKLVTIHFQNQPKNRNNLDPKRSVIFRPIGIGKNRKKRSDDNQYKINHQLL